MDRYLKYIAHLMAHAFHLKKMLFKYVYTHHHYGD